MLGYLNIHREQNGTKSIPGWCGLNKKDSTTNFLGYKIREYFYDLGEGGRDLLNKTLKTLSIREEIDKLYSVH